MLSCKQEKHSLNINEGTCLPINSVAKRTALCLDGDWNAMLDIYETGYYNSKRQPRTSKSWFKDRSFYSDPTRLVEYDFDAAGTLKVPGDWNTQRPELFLYEGTVWYRKKFDLAADPSKRYFIWFDGANYETVAGLNGNVLGRHEGGFTPFGFEVTGALKDKDNSLVVKVDNRRRDENVPTVNFDWWNYGGITRSVRVLETPAVFIRDWTLALDKGDPSFICGEVVLDGKECAGVEVSVKIPELGIEVQSTAGAGGHAAFRVKAAPERWSPSSPKLYEVCLSTADDSVCDRIGFRTVETRGHVILLNGEPVFLAGISIHEEKPFDAGGRAFSEEDARTTLGWAKELGCNFVRLAHYPHNETMVRTAEEMGLMVWSEIPVYWTIDWENPRTYANAQAQLRDNIARDHNRCNIIVWSVANETPVGAPGRKDFLYGLMDTARELGGNRLVAAAMEKTYLNDTTVTINDPELFAKADVGSFNEYVGWYDGKPEKCDALNWTFSLDKPIFISEFGGGAKYGNHGPAEWLFTEENQKLLYEKNLAMLGRIEQLAGMSPWILKDFRSPKRPLPGIQDNYNRKGLVSEYGEKKAAFQTLQSWYLEKLKNHPRTYGSVRFENLAGNDSLGRKAVSIASRVMEEKAGRKLDEENGKLCVRLSIKAGIPEEGYRISRSQGPSVKIEASSAAGLLYGLGAWLHAAEISAEGITPGKCDGESVPQKKLRGMYFATHYQNFYHVAPLAEVKKYMEDLAIWGCNSICVWLDLHHYSGMDDPAAIEMVGRLSQIARYGKALGMSVCLATNANEGFSTTPEKVRAVPPVKTGLGMNPTDICPSAPGGTELILKNRRECFQAFINAGLVPDYYWIFPYDEGGCDCDACRQWGTNGFVRITRDITAMVKEMLPGTKSILSTWGFDCYKGRFVEKGEYSGLADIINRDGPWTDFLLVDSHREYPRWFLENPSPAGLPVLNFPEISMWGNRPWGGYGANPQIERLDSIYHEASHVISGGWPYSEGVYEDLNKILYLGFYWDDSLSGEEIARSYVRFEYSHELAPRIMAVLHTLEKNYGSKFRTRSWTPGEEVIVNVPEADYGAEACWEEVRKLDSLLPEAVAKGWRWRLVYVRAYLDYALRMSGGRITPEMIPYLEETTRISGSQIPESWRGVLDYQNVHFEKR